MYTFIPNKTYIVWGTNEKEANRIVIKKCGTNKFSSYKNSRYIRKEEEITLYGWGIKQNETRDISKESWMEMGR